MIMIRNLKQTNAGDLNVSYFESGSPNGTPIILLHGFPYDIFAYQDVSTMLTNLGYKVIVPYLRGYGKTRFLKIGRDGGFKKSSGTTTQQGLGYIEPSFNKIARFFENKKMISVALGALILVTILYLLV